MFNYKWIEPGGDISDALNLRIEIFVDEQKFVDEIDETDPVAHHLVVSDKDGKAVGVLRIFPKTENADTYVIGRVAVSKALRGTGLGGEIMKQAEDKAAKLGAKNIVLSAQVRVKSFYEKQGYECYGDEYMDENCPHIGMMKQL